MVVFGLQYSFFPSKYIVFNFKFMKEYNLYPDMLKLMFSMFRILYLLITYEII